MYCPKCAAQNSAQVKFCRVCGENLTVVAQAMAKHLPVTLVSKLDNYLDRKHERLRRDGILTGLSGLFLLLSGTWQWVHAGGWPTVFMLLGALILFLASAWDMLVYKRSQVRRSQESEHLVVTRDERTANSHPQIHAVSVTEETTRLLDTARNHSASEG